MNERTHAEENINPTPFHVFQDLGDVMPDVGRYLGGSGLLISRPTEALMLETIEMLNTLPHGGPFTFGVIDDDIRGIRPEDCTDW